MQRAINVPYQPWRVKEVYLEKRTSQSRRGCGKWVGPQGRGRVVKEAGREVREKREIQIQESAQRLGELGGFGNCNSVRQASSVRGNYQEKR